MSASWERFAGRPGTGGRTSSLEEGFGLGPLTTMSPSNVPFLSPRLRSPATRPLGPGPLCLSAFNPVTGRSPCLLGDSCGLFAAFGDLEDESKLGELPSDDDLLLRFFDPQPHLLQQPLFAENDNGAQPLAPAVTALWPTHAASLHNLGGSGAAQRGAVRSLAPAAPLPFLYLDEPAGMIHGGVKRSSELPDRKDVVEAKRAAVWEQSEDADSPRSTLHRHRSLPARPQAAPSPHAAARGGSSSRSAAEPAAAGDSSAQASPGLVFRGVSRHRLTQRWEASLWLAGRQLYLGGFDSQGDAARAYDLAALACKGLDAVINYPPAEYAQQLADIKDFTREEVVAYVRRRSAAFSRGKSRHRGVSGHNGRWEARIGSFGGRKNVSFGVFETEAGAAKQYDRALILEKGRSAKTNFPLREYEAEVAEFEAYMMHTCGSLSGSAAARVAQEYTLPRDRVATADEKKRSAIIYGQAMRDALRGPE